MTFEGSEIPTLSWAIEAFLLAVTVAGRSRYTVDLYSLSLRPLIGFLGDRPISDARVTSAIDGEIEWDAWERCSKAEAAEQDSLALYPDNWGKAISRQTSR